MTDVVNLASVLYFHSTTMERLYTTMQFMLFTHGLDACYMKNAAGRNDVVNRTLEWCLCAALCVT